VKIYTRTGDDGSTGLIGGRRLRKDHLRIDAYGTIDELSAVLAAVCNAEPRWVPPVHAIQAELFVLGSHLAAPDGPVKNVQLPPLPADAAQRMEREIDAADEKLPPLKNFILPGGTEAAVRLHLARCVCRRAERLCVALAGTEDVPAQIIVYLNRLSDWLFTMARLANHDAGVQDIVWRAS
jgi:cob(I)alamin adenosyltransferase